MLCSRVVLPKLNCHWCNMAYSIQQDQKCNGYTNAQTFLVSLYLNNTKKHQDAVLDIFRGTNKTNYNMCLGLLVLEVKRLLPNIMQEDPWAWHDNVPMRNQVDWDQIAQELIQSIKEGA